MAGSAQLSFEIVEPCRWIGGSSFSSRMQNGAPPSVTSRCPPSGCVKLCALATRPLTPIVQVPALIGVADAAKDGLADIMTDGLAAGTSEAKRRERRGILISSLLWSQPVIEFASSGARD